MFQRKHVKCRILSSRDILEGYFEVMSFFSHRWSFFLSFSLYQDCLALCTFIFLGSTTCWHTLFRLVSCLFQTTLSYLLQARKDFKWLPWSILIALLSLPHSLNELLGTILIKVGVWLTMSGFITLGCDIDKTLVLRAETSVQNCGSLV